MNRWRQRTLWMAVAATLVVVVAGPGRAAPEDATPAPTPSLEPFPTEWPYATPTEIPSPTPPPEYELVRFRGHVGGVNPDNSLIFVSHHAIRVNHRTILLGPDGPVGLEEFQRGEGVAVVAYRRVASDPETAEHDPPPPPLIGLFIAKLTPPPAETPTPTPTATPEPTIPPDPQGTPFPTEWPYPTPTDIPGPPPDTHVVHFAGRIRAMDAERHMMRVSDHSVHVTSRTLLVGLHGPMRFQDYQVGEMVAVIAYRSRLPGEESEERPHVVYDALLVAQTEPAPHPHPMGRNRVGGRIDAVDRVDESFVIRGGRTRVLTSERTVISDRETTGLPFDVLHRHQVVTAVGEWVSTPTLFDARFVRILGPRPPYDPGTSVALVVRHGFIMEKETPERLHLNTGVDVVVTTRTRAFHFPHEEMEPSRLRVGDLVRVAGTTVTLEGEIATDAAETLVARRIHARPAIVHMVSTETLSFEASHLHVATSEGTEIVDREGQPLTFEDIGVGDLVRLRGDFVTTDTMDSSSVAILRQGEPTSGVPGLNPIVGRRGPQGTWELECTTNVLGFGFIGFPEDAIPSADGMVYRVRALVDCDVAEPWRAPKLRMRFTSQDLQKVQLLVVDNTGDGFLSPRPAGRWYEHMIVPPPVDPEAGEEVDDIFFSFDVVNMNPNNQAHARVRVHHMVVDGFPSEAVQTLDTLAEYTFEDGAEDWQFVSLPGVFTPPVGRPTSGGLTIQPRDENSFGFWSRVEDGVFLAPGAMYRLRALVQSNAPNVDEIPGFRLRVNSTSYQLASVTLLNSMGDGQALPTEDGAALDTFLVTPPDLPRGQNPIFSFDLKNFDANDDVGVELILDEVVFERVRLTP